MVVLGLKTLIIAAVITLSFCSRGGKVASDRGRIVGGELIRIQEAPYQVSLRQFEFHICGGAIISANHVITAAHCTYGSYPAYLSVLVGATKNFEGGDVHNITEIKNHPYFNLKTFDYDAAILILQTPIKLNGWSKQLIILPNTNDPITENQAVLASGWGETRNEDENNTDLRAVILFVSNQRKCHLLFVADGGVTSRMVCAFALNKDSCSGDSGGPLRRLSDNKLVGLVSFGSANECASPTYPGVYTRIAAIRPWIWSIIGF